VRVESGVILEVLNNYVKERGYIVPLDPGSKVNCHIGGNVATNAAGIRLLRYGSLHENILGLETVTGNGDVLNTLYSMRKDNTGFDLKQLFIGSQGALGIVTKVAIQLVTKPTSTQLAFLACNTFSDVLEIYKKSRYHLGEILSAFEFMDSESLELVLKNVANTQYPLSNKHRFYVLIETSGSDRVHDIQKLETMLTQNPVKEGVIAQDERQASNIWKLRETCGDANVKEGYVRYI
jgi:FAD/FMN-containing dehydrogenase